MSPLLYMYYNADLLDVPERNELGLGFIDDIAYGVQGHSGKENAGTLKRMLEKAEKWKTKHGARFRNDKVRLGTLHTTENGRNNYTNPNRRYPHTTISGSKIPRCNFRQTPAVQTPHPACHQKGLQVRSGNVKNGKKHLGNLIPQNPKTLHLGSCTKNRLCGNYLAQAWKIRTDN